MADEGARAAPHRRRRGARDTKPFDATTKHLLESDPGAWLRFVGLPTDAPVVAVDADVSTIIAAADKVLRVADPAPWLAQVELQASYDPSLPTRRLHYNVSLLRRHGLPVASAIVLLRPEADGPSMTGALDLAWSGTPYLSFAYRVVRTWEQPVEGILAGGLGTLPLAPIADVSPAALPDVLRRTSSAGWPSAWPPRRRPARPPRFGPPRSSWLGYDIPRR